MKIKQLILVFKLISTLSFSQTEIDVLVEIESGSTIKYEYKKGAIVCDSVENKVRIIDYLNYPFNYGFIINSSKQQDNDYLDAVLIGNRISSGDTLSGRVICMIETIDNDEEDNKVVLIHSSSSLYKNVQNLNDLNTYYPGVIEIIKIWFDNYKKESEVKRVLNTEQTMKKISDYLLK